MNINITAGYYNKMTIDVGDYTFKITDKEGEAIACGAFASGIEYFYSNADGIKYNVNNIESIILDVVAVLQEAASKYTLDIDIITDVSHVLDTFDYDSISMTVEF